MRDFDMIIVGGGLVGAGLAVALREANMQIALIDAHLPSATDPRLFALTSSSCEFLKNIGAFPALLPHATPIHAVHVSRQGYFGTVRLEREEVGLAALGHVVPACFIEAVLYELLLSLPQVTLYRPAVLQSLCHENNQALVTLSTAQGEVILCAPLVVGADGAESTVRRQMHIAAERIDQQQTAIVTRTTLKGSHQHIAYERFHAEGVIAMLPLLDQECATIWTVDQAKGSELMALSDDVFLQRLQQAFGYRLGRLQKTGPRHSFPLCSVYAEKTAEQCVFLLGNAAHTLPPIAAQGFNLALYEVAVLVEDIMARRAKNLAITSHDLREISEKIVNQQATSIAISQRLSRLFSHRSPWMSMALQLGMMGLQIATPIKQRFIQKLLGRSGRVPALLLPRSN